MAQPLPERGPEQERSLVELIRDLGNEVTTLIRQEIELARAEMSQKGAQLRRGAVSFGIVAVVGIGAFAALTTCMILALTYAIAPVWAALVVAAFWALVAGVFALIGRSQIRQAAPPTPQQTVETVKEDVEWLKNRR